MAIHSTTPRGRHHAPARPTAHPLLMVMWVLGALAVAVAAAAATVHLAGLTPWPLLVVACCMSAVAGLAGLAYVAVTFLAGRRR